MKAVMKGLGANTTYWLDNVQVTKEAFDAAVPSLPLDGESPGGHLPGAWPMLSDALAVHPRQIGEVMARNAKHGLHVEYNPEDGRPILKDRGQRRDLMRVERCHDNDGGYGD